MIYFEIQIKGFNLKNKRKLKSWLNDLILHEGFSLNMLTYIFLSDDELLNINKQYLNHNTYTDIITFDNSESNSEIEGDIFISIDRIKENASKFKVEFEIELLRVISHGLLHLCGYLDKKPSDIAIMREKENFYIQKYGEF